MVTDGGSKYIKDAPFVCAQGEALKGKVRDVFFMVSGDEPFFIY